MMRALALAILGSLVLTPAHAQQEKKADEIVAQVKANLTAVRFCAYAEARIQATYHLDFARTIAAKAVTECRSRFPLPAHVVEYMKARSPGQRPAAACVVQAQRARPFNEGVRPDFQLQDPQLQDPLLKGFVHQGLVYQDCLFLEIVRYIEIYLYRIAI